nr:RNA dependent RNA polymerase fusion P1-P2 protein [Blueberry virus L]
MTFFAMLIGASTKVVKEFVNYIFSKARQVYMRFKKWLWELNGSFAGSDAFVDMCYGYIDDVEDFEIALQHSYAEMEHEVALAKHKLNQLLSPYTVGPLELFHLVEPTRPSNAEVEQIIAAEIDLSYALSLEIETVREVKEAYAEQKGDDYFGRIFNTLPQRMHYVKRALARRRKTDKLSVRVKEEASKIVQVPDFIACTVAEEVPTGKTVVVKKISKDGEDRSFKEPELKWVRRIADGHHHKAADFIRAYVRNRNARLSADEISCATVQRYAEQFCQKMEMDEESTCYLVSRALRMVPIPTKTEINDAMIIHCPVAEELRHRMAVIQAPGFLDGLCQESGFESPFSLLGLPDVVVYGGGTPRKLESKISYLSQFSLGLTYQCPQPSLHNALVAVERRVFTVGKGDEIILPPLARDNQFEKLNYFRDAIVSKVGYCKTYSPMELALTYSSSKRAAYIRAVLSLRHEPVSVRDSYVTAFLKMEKHHMCKKIAPRLICPRTKRYNVEVGRRLKFNEKKFMHAIDSVFEAPTVLSGYDSFSVGRIIAKKWNKFKTPVAIGVDASRFDQHVSLQALQWEHSIYKLVFGDAELDQLLDWQCDNNVKLFVEDKVLKFKVEGHRMSGDINTSMGNKLVMCGMMHNYFRELGVRAELCNNGDDCVIICEQEDEHRFNDIYNWFLQYGFSMVLEKPVYELEKLEFCQSRPVCIGGEWRMVRRPDSIAKDAHSLLSMATKEDVKSFMSATAQCGLILNSGVPILEAYHRCLYRGSGFKKVSDDYLRRVIEFGNDERLGTKREYQEQPITLENRLSYWRSFGVDPVTQVTIERYFDELTVCTELRGVKRLTPLLQAIVLNVES